MIKVTIEQFPILRAQWNHSEEFKEFDSGELYLQFVHLAVSKKEISFQALQFFIALYCISNWHVTIKSYNKKYRNLKERKLHRKWSYL